MSDYPDLSLFLDEIMRVNVLRMGGASAGILGTTGADNDIVSNLKKTAISFAQEYSKALPDNKKLETLSNNIYGFFQTLQLLHTLSEERAKKLTNDLQILLERFSD